MRRLVLALAAALLAAAPASAHDRAAGGPAPRAAAAGEACPGTAGFRPGHVRTGRFGRALMGSYVMVPFEVPAGTTQVRVRLCFDQPESADVPRSPRHTLDLGLWDPERFRGWGGSSHPEAQVTPQGFGPRDLYEREPKANVPGRTTRGFRPGPIPAGTWEAELGVASVASEGDRDGTVAWRLEVELSSDPAFAAEPYRPAPWPEAPARPGPGWYVGDLHVHAEHSSLGDATMHETFRSAFGEAGLDFVMLSDYVTDSAWGEIPRDAAAHPGKLVARSSEVITYSGHLNNHVSGTYVDHRAGAVRVLRPDGSLAPRRPARSGNDLLRAVRAAGGVTQVNHPTIFPSAVPGFASLCRGCPWDFAGTDWSLVDAIEVATGPPGIAGLGNNPFTTTAIDFYERALASGARIAAVAVSDSHNAGRTKDMTQAPVGTGATAVYADELSEDGLRRALRAGHTYAKVFGARGPDLLLEAQVGSAEPPAIMGDVVRASTARLTAVVRGGEGQRLELWRDGAVAAATVVRQDPQRVTWTAERPGRYRLQLSDGGAVTTLTTPVWLDPSAPRPAGDADPRLPADVRLGPARRLRFGRSRVRCAAEGLGLERCVVRQRANGRTIARGSAPLRGGRALVRLRPTAAGRALARRRDRFRATLEARATGPRGSAGPERRRVTVRVPRR